MSTRRDRAGWLVLAAVLAVEWALFRQYALREITWRFPLGMDQASYLLKSYTIYEGLWSDGLRGAARAFRVLMPQGFLLQLEAAGLFLFTGPSRLGALALNFLHFAALQCVVAAALRCLHRGWSVPALGVGLLLCAALPFQEYGGMPDFRLDFATACLFGMFAAAGLCADGFRRRGWTIACVALAVACVWTRHIAVTYVLGLLGAFAVFVALRRGVPRRGTTLRRTLLAAAVVAALTAPALWANRQNLYHYYVVGHVTGAEKSLRARQFGVNSTADALLFYPRSVARDHTGPAFLWGAGLVGAAVLLSSTPWLRRRPESAAEAPPAIDLGYGFAFLGLSVVVPLAILTADESKSPIVGGVVVPSLALLVALVAATTLGRTGVGVQALKALGALAVLAGLCGYATHTVTPVRSAQDRVDAMTMTGVYDALADYGRSVRAARPLRIAGTAWREHVWPAVLPVMFYERHGWLTDFRVPSFSIFQPEREAFLAGVAASDVVLLRDPEQGPAAYPYEKAMRSLHPELVALCEREFFLLKQVHVFGGGLRVYVRPAATVDGVSGDWVTASGIRLRAHGDLLSDRPRIRFSGSWPTGWLAGRTPRACGTLEVEGRHPVPVPARVSVGGEAYAVELDVRAEDVRGTPAASVHVVFDSYVVPGGADPRPLAVRAPDRVQLLRREAGDVPASPCPFDPSEPVDASLAPAR